jgi:hypothetical protein
MRWWGRCCIRESPSLTVEALGVWHIRGTGLIRYCPAPISGQAQPFVRWPGVDMGDDHVTRESVEGGCTGCGRAHLGGSSSSS